MLIHPPKLLKNIFPEFIWKVDTQNKTLYLTFDDGPIPVITENVLNILKTFDAKATFFCVGENVMRNPDIYARILKEGHSVGNHTYSHLNGSKTNTEVYVENVEKASEYIDSELFRPPHGRIKTAQYLELSKKYKVILWDVLSYDFDKTKHQKECLKNVKHFARPGSIIVLHDSIKANDNMIYTLINTLTYFSFLGYKFERITTDLFNILAQKQIVENKIKQAV